MFAAPLGGGTLHGELDLGTLAGRRHIEVKHALGHAVGWIELVLL